MADEESEQDTPLIVASHTPITIDPIQPHPTSSLRTRIQNFQGAFTRAKLNKQLVNRNLYITAKCWELCDTLMESQPHLESPRG